MGRTDNEAQVNIISDKKGRKTGAGSKSAESFRADETFRVTQETLKHTTRVLIDMSYMTKYKGGESTEAVGSCKPPLKTD